MYFFLWRSILFKQSVQTLMKFRIMYYFIWVFDVCKSTRILGNHERHSGLVLKWRGRWFKHWQRIFNGRVGDKQDKLVFALIIKLSLSDWLWVHVYCDQWQNKQCSFNYFEQCILCNMPYVLVSNCLFMSGRFPAFLDWTSTKQRIKYYR